MMMILHKKKQDFLNIISILCSTPVSENPFKAHENIGIDVLSAPVFENFNRKTNN